MEYIGWFGLVICLLVYIFVCFSSCIYSVSSSWTIRLWLEESKISRT